MTENQKKSIQSYDQSAEKFDQTVGKLKNYNHAYDFFADQILNASTVLDLACGPAQISKYLLSKKPDLKIYGVDLSKGMLDVAKKNIPDAKFFCDSILDFSAEKNCGFLFDACVLGFGIPYLSSHESRVCILNASKNLKSGGIFYISFMDTKTDSNGQKPDESCGLEKTSFGGENLFEQHYHKKELIAEYLVESDFELIKEFEMTYTESDGSLTRDIVFIAKKI